MEKMEKRYTTWVEQDDLRKSEHSIMEIPNDRQTLTIQEFLLDIGSPTPGWTQNRLGMRQITIPENLGMGKRSFMLQFPQLNDNSAIPNNTTDSTVHHIMERNLRNNENWYTFNWEEPGDLR